MTTTMKVITKKPVLLGCLLITLMAASSAAPEPSTSAKLVTSSSTNTSQVSTTFSTTSTITTKPSADTSQPTSTQTQPSTTTTRNGTTVQTNTSTTSLSATTASTLTTSETVTPNQTTDQTTTGTSAATSTTSDQTTSKTTSASTTGTTLSSTVTPSAMTSDQPTSSTTNKTTNHGGRLNSSEVALTVVFAIGLGVVVLGISAYSITKRRQRASPFHHQRLYNSAADDIVDPFEPPADTLVISGGLYDGTQMSPGEGGVLADQMFPVQPSRLRLEILNDAVDRTPGNGPSTSQRQP